MRWTTERSAFHSKSHKIRLTDWMTDCLESSRISIGIVRLNGAETPKHMLPTMISIKMLIKLHVLRWLHFAFANDFITHLTNAMNSSLYKYANREYEQNFMLNYQIPSPIRSCTSLINITHTHTHTGFASVYPLNWCALCSCTELMYLPVDGWQGTQFSSW